MRFLSTIALGLLAIGAADALSCVGECQQGAEFSMMEQGGHMDTKGNSLEQSFVAAQADDELGDRRLGYAACVDGSAGGFECSGYDLQSFIPLSELGPTPVAQGAGIRRGSATRSIDGWHPVCQACYRNTTDPTETDAEVEEACSAQIKLTIDENTEPCSDDEPAAFCSACADGAEDTAACRSTLTNDFCNEGNRANDIWGWTDPETGREYALQGLKIALAFIDITNPNNPVYLGRLRSGGIGLAWGDVKVYKNVAYYGTEAQGVGYQIFDLTRLRGLDGAEPIEFEADKRYTEFGSSHNVVINEASGYAYAVGTRTCNGGLHFINIQDPLNPVFEGCFSEDNYTHDAECINYEGPDLDYQGREICFASNEDTLTIVDVTDKANPVQIARVFYTGGESKGVRAATGYTHQSAISEDHRYVFLDDELDEFRRVFPAGGASNPDTGRVTQHTYVFDVSNLDYPINSYTYDSNLVTIDHNQYVKGDLVFQANYFSGVRVVKYFEAPTFYMKEAGFFDPTPVNQISFGGVWSVYPYFPSGNIVFSWIEKGFFVVKANQDFGECDSSCNWSQLLARTSSRK